jgi:hypothetical protein
MGFGIRTIFPGAGAGLRQFQSRFQLTPPISVRNLAAHTAIAAKYQQLGNFKGPLGLILSAVKVDVGDAFIRSFSGGDVHFTDNGQTLVNPLFQTTITYVGAHCFGNPAGLGSDSVYLLVSVYPPGNPDQAVVFKIPDDGGAGLINDFERGQDSNDGVRVIWGGTQKPPQPLVITTMVMGSSLFGDSTKVKEKVKEAVLTAASEANAAEGEVASPSQLDFLANAFATIFGGLLDALGLTDQVRGRPQSIQLRRDTAGDDFIPQAPPKQQGPIRYNFETPLLTDGDASYKAYFNVVTDQLSAP